MGTPAALTMSKNNDWYTPAYIAEPARKLLRGIELDPASCQEANLTIQAERFYTIEQNGLMYSWRCRSMFINPPYGRTGGKSNQAVWTRKLVVSHETGLIEEAICVVNAVPGNKWYAPLWKYVICYPDHRVNFETPTGDDSGPTHSTAIVYLGKRVAEFVELFKEIGPIAQAISLPRKLQTFNMELLECEVA